MSTYDRPPTTKEIRMRLVNECPHCKSDAVSGRDFNGRQFNALADFVTQTLGCDECGREWDAFYDLSFIALNEVEGDRSTRKMIHPRDL